MLSQHNADELLAMRRALEHFQVARLQRDFADLMRDPQYIALGEFFFHELYAPRDFSDRNASAHRLYALLRNVPGVKVAQLDRAMRLMELTDALDIELARLLLHTSSSLIFDEARYEQAYRAANAYAERVEQLDLIVAVVHDTYSAARVPFSLWQMRRVMPMAQRLGFGPLAHFLTAGLEAVQPVRDIRYFTDTLYGREKQRLDRIYLSA
jgi:AraC-like DNA-binding protein